MAKYLDENGLLFVIQELKSKFAQKEHIHGVATAAKDGFISAADKTKLDKLFNTEISTVISEESTDLTAASSKAVREYVKSVLANVAGFTAEIIERFPADGGQAGVIYLLDNSTTQGDNAYSEYMWINNKWELIGSTAVNLSEYVKASELTPLTNSEIETIFSVAEG